MYFIRTRGAETTTHTKHIFHGTLYLSPVPALSKAVLVDLVYNVSVVNIVKGAQMVF